ncbi:hypothetical protein SNE40_010456 [Patella caerulea]|uniref:Homeobox domain-containing protein n=1 Tax=Patella caerulea TaxID=87958 RepID=A0AAN8K1P6_PATCE
MIHTESLRPVHNTQGLRHYESSDSNSSCTSPPVITHLNPSRPALAPGDNGNNTLVHWTQAPSSYDKITDKSDDDDEIDDEYRPFTPPPPRERLSYTRYQLELLSGIYEKVRYPNSTQKLLIAKRVGITREQVKIWFQNRRRKDVINNPKRKGNSSTESSDSLTSAESEPNTPPQSEDSKPSSPADIDGPKMVPNVVLKSVIDELERFEKTVLKAKKSKKKSRPKQQQQAQQKMSTTAIKANAASLFTAYDMVSPPNKVISPAMLNTSINRFSHSKTTSAFQDPKSNGEANGSPHNASPLMNGYHQLPNNISVLPNQYSPHHSSGMTSSSVHHPKAHPAFENIPVLADLLGYRSSESIRSQKQHLNHSLSPHNSYVVSPNRGATDRGYTDIPGSVNHGSLGVNRVFPFPFIADAPVMLSSMRHPDPYRPPVHYLPQQHSEDPYQSFMISSLTNPYYTASPSQSWTPHPHPPPPVSTDNYTQNTGL